MGASVAREPLPQPCELGWIARVKDSRAVSLTRKGITGFRNSLGIAFPVSESGRRAA